MCTSDYSTFNTVCKLYRPSVVGDITSGRFETFIDKYSAVLKYQGCTTMPQAPSTRNEAQMSRLGITDSKHAWLKELKVAGR